MAGELELDVVVTSAAADEVRNEVESAQGRVLNDQEPYVLPAHQLDLFGDQQFEPLLVLSVSAGIGFLIDRISRVYQRHTKRGGAILDATGDTPILIETDVLDHGEILVINKQGNEAFLLGRDDSTLETVVGAVTSAVGG